MVEASVIVPAYNAAKRISFCVESLLTQQTTRKYEIIVVDDGSTDNTAEIMASFPVARLLRQENSGPAAARNHGAREARGRILLFTDDDCIAEGDWLEKMLKPFDIFDIAGVKGTYLSRQTEITARFVQIEYEEKYDELKKHEYIDFIDTYSAGFRKKVFLDAGGYDSQFRTASVEDQEFSFRLADAGHKMVFVPGAQVWHTHVDSISGYARKKFKIGYWKALLLTRNPRKAKGDSHTPATLKLQIILIGAFALSILVAFFSGIGLFISTVLLIAFLATMQPLVIRALKKDFAVGVYAPLFITIRAASLLSGLLKGGVDFYIKGKNKKESEKKQG
ncbi:MAG: glycosyltransferase [Nitrospinota bacterium]|nr:glycosyltransferase [Nitrospinota bacterium]